MDCTIRDPRRKPISKEMLIRKVRDSVGHEGGSLDLGGGRSALHEIEEPLRLTLNLSRSQIIAKWQYL